MVNNKGEVVGIVESKITYENVENIGYAVTSMTLIDFLEKRAHPRQGLTEKSRNS